MPICLPERRKYYFHARLGVDRVPTVSLSSALSRYFRSWKRKQSVCLACPCIYIHTDLTMLPRICRGKRSIFLCLYGVKPPSFHFVLGRAVLSLLGGPASIFLGGAPPSSRRRLLVPLFDCATLRVVGGILVGVVGRVWSFGVFRKFYLLFESFSQPVTTTYDYRCQKSTDSVCSYLGARILEIHSPLQELLQARQVC